MPFFGRFLIATVGSLSDQILTSIAAGAVEIAMRALILKKERVINWAQIRFLKSKLNYNEAKERAYAAQFNNNAMVVEHASIIVVPFLLHFFYKHRLVFNFSYTSEEASVEMMYRSALVQFFIQTIVHFVSCVLESELKIPNIQVWMKERWVYAVWEIANFVQILTLIIYVFKTLPSAFFCDNTDPCSCRDINYQDFSLFRAEGYCT